MTDLGVFLFALREEIIVSLIVGVGSFLLLNTIQQARKLYLERRGPLSGFWIQRIYSNDFSEPPIKVDLVRCRDTSGELKADITRIYPRTKVQLGRSWILKGEYSRDLLLATFENKIVNDHSRGTIIMWQAGVSRFRGTYSKPKQTDAGALVKENAISTILMDWEYRGKELPDVEEILRFLRLETDAHHSSAGE